MLQQKIITVIAKDHNGLLADVTEILSKAAINLISIKASAYHLEAVLHLEIDLKQIDEALRLLTQAGFHAMSDEMIAMSLDIQGGLSTQNPCSCRLSKELKMLSEAFRKSAVAVCDAKIKQKGVMVGLSFYAFFKNKNDDPELLMNVAEWWIRIHKLDHFEKATKIKQMMLDMT